MTLLIYRMGFAVSSAGAHENAKIGLIVGETQLIVNATNEPTTKLTAEKCFDA